MGSQPRSIRRQFPPVGRQRGTTQKAHHSTDHLYERTSFLLTTEHSRHCAASVRNHCVESGHCAPATLDEAVELRRFSGNGPITPPHLLSTHGRQRWWTTALHQLSAHAAPLVSPRSSSSTHGKLCDDPITGRLHDGSLFRMFQRRGRGSRLNSWARLFFLEGLSPMPSEIKSHRLRRCFGSRSSGIEIALVRGRRDV